MLWFATSSAARFVASCCRDGLGSHRAADVKGLVERPDRHVDHRRERRRA